jgi:AcrR family transcriptional regulator
MPAHCSLKERQRQERENLILQAAEDVLLEKGYHDISMDEIAARVGIAKGTLYLHFAKKEDLLFTFFERELRNILECIEQARAMQDISAQLKLQSVVLGMYQDFSVKRAELLYILHNSTDFKMEIKCRAESSLQGISDGVSALLDEGKVNGEFDVSLPTAVMVNSFFSILSPRGYRHLLVEQKMSPDDILHSVMKIFFRGIGGHVPDEARC